LFVNLSQISNSQCVVLSARLHVLVGQEVEAPNSKLQITNHK